MKPIFLYLSIFFFFTACKKNEPHPQLSSEAAISKKIDKLYSTYGNSNDALYNKPFSDSLFSPELKATLEDAVNASKADIEKVKQSDHPDEKPLLFEGAVFSSLYEGYNSYKIKSVVIDPSGTSADASVAFEYRMSPPKVSWTDKVHLIKSGQEWKVDNIVFDSIGNSKDLKASLKDFVQSTKQ
ncbi:DUF3828 domain-containing protein [Chryseobacterium shigense]|uniref:DUF3828 domain-containing protein n=1 Tax=Chryseobacterium shigense TaxID=297244 RepID=A0A841N046_9FLAO|nr:DUF3828 domain-containing protein [Chryseobacterium shigense]MBB6370174.1 hypothetical protein [Chryseobacterium shigense]